MTKDENMFYILSRDRTAMPEDKMRRHSGGLVSHKRPVLCEERFHMEERRMAKIDFSGIVALAKAGFTYANVKELMALSGEEQQEPDPLEKPEGAEEQQEKEPEQPNPQKEADHEDLSALYDKETEKLKAQISEIQKQLESAQKNNVRKDMSNQTQKSDEQILQEAMRNFY